MQSLGKTPPFVVGYKRQMEVFYFGLRRYVK